MKKKGNLEIVKSKCKTSEVNSQEKNKNDNQASTSNMLSEIRPSTLSSSSFQSSSSTSSSSSSSQTASTPLKRKLIDAIEKNDLDNAKKLVCFIKNDLYKLYPYK
tara:strand:+ start:81 stop:395 length:315 start_codon:yes stop_codon:yes gene_type:complete